MLTRLRILFLWLGFAALAAVGFWWTGHSHEPKPPPGRTEISWMFFVSPLQDFYEQEVAEFERLHPDITVRLIVVPASEYHMKFKTLAAAGEAPDLFYAGDVWMSYLLPFMHDLTPLVQRDAKEIGLDDYFPEIRVAMQDQGHYYVVPEAVNVALLYYNRRLFDEAHLPYPTARWTWDDLVKNAVALTKPPAGNQPGVWGCSRVEGWWGEWLTYVRQAGGTVFSPDGHRCVLDSPEAVTGLRFFQDKALKYHYSAPAGFEPINGFVNGRVAMEMVGHVNFWLNYNQMPGLDWDIQMLPIGPASRKGGEMAIAGYSINRRTRHLDAAWALLKFLTQPAATAEIVRRGSISPRRSVAEAQLKARRPGEHPQNLAAAYEQMSYALPIPRHPDFIEVMLQIVQPEIDRMVQGAQTPEETARRATDAVNAYLATFDPPPAHE